MVEIILSAIILVLLVERVWTQIYHLKVVDRLTDKVLSRSYTDYQAGQLLKAPEEDPFPSRSDEDEVAIEKERERARNKISFLDKEIEGVTPR